VASAAFKAALPAGQNHFHRTRKGNGVLVHSGFAATPEAVLGTLLVAGALTIYATNIYRFFELDLFAAILLIQSLPFLSAVALAGLERFGERKSRQLAAVRAAG
jgi:hypothetical protein